MYRTNAREQQDFFVLAMTNKKQNGTYVEVGGCYPIEWNNTYLLEESFGWRGVSIEWDSNLVSQWPGVRKNPCLCVDATTVDYNALFEKRNLGPHIDYLQLDVDPPSVTMQVLHRIDFKKYSFSVITYEHDWYQGGDKERLESRQILESHGYVRVISDVMHGDLKFEDWYIHPEHVPESIWQEFAGEAVNLNPANCDNKYTELFKQLM
jgi:hypothetical protein